MLIKINKSPDNKLFEAYKKHDLEKFKELIRQGENVNCISDDKSLIFSVIMNWEQVPSDLNKQFFDALIEAGVHLGQIGDEPRLLSACLVAQNTTYHYMKTLLDNKINTDLKKERICDNYERNIEPLIFDFIWTKNWENLRLLLKYKPNLNVYDSSKEPVLNSLIDKISSNESDLIKLFIAGGANVNNISTGGITALHKLCETLEDTHNIDVLLKAGADINAADSRTKYTALHRAVSAGLVGNMKHLIKMGADVNKKDSLGNPASFLAVSKSNPDALEILSNSDIDLSHTTDWGHNVCHHICTKSKEYFDENPKDAKKFIDFMKNHLELLSAKDGFDRTPLQYLQSRLPKETSKLIKLVNNSQKTL